MSSGVCSMDFVLPDQRKVSYKHNFFNASADAIRGMFIHGNYACDCNRSLFIQEVIPDFQEMDCGEQIQLVNLRVELIDE